VNRNNKKINKPTKSNRSKDIYLTKYTAKYSEPSELKITQKLNYCFSQEKFFLQPKGMSHTFDVDNLLVYVRHNIPFSTMPLKALPHACKQPTTKGILVNISTFI
jgi:hypothetical protein